MWAQIQQRAPNAAAIAQDISTAYRYSKNIGKAYGAYKLGEMAYGSYKKRYKRRSKNRSPTGRRMYAGYRSNARAGLNRIVSRKRRGTRYRRRRLRWGTKVRKQALGLYEGKRYSVADTELAVPVNTIKRYRPMIEMVTDIAPGVGSSLGGQTTISKKLRTGMKIFVRGIKVQIHIRNQDTANPVDVRIICGWRTKGAVGGIMTNAPNRIFKKRSTTEEPVELASTTEAVNMPMMTINAPLCSSKYFKCHKDMVVRLGVQGGVGSDDQGAGFKIVNLWWELNNRTNKLEVDDTLPVAGDAENIMDWFPCVHYYHTDPSNAIPSAAVDYKFLSTVYWKDPLG